MTHTKARAARISGAVAAVAAGLALVGGVATPALATTDTGGTLTLTVDGSFALKAAESGVVFLPQSPASASYGNGTLSVTFPVTGGNANVTRLSGTLTLGGTLRVVDFATGSCEKFSNLTFSYGTAQLSGTPAEGGDPVPLADARGVRKGAVNSDGSQTFTASSLTIDGNGASYLDGKLSTDYFTGGQVAGSLATTYTIS